MSRSRWFGLVVAVVVCSGTAWADAPTDHAIDTIEARLRALEQRVSDLEQKNADLARKNAELERHAVETAPAPASAAAPVAAAEPAPEVAAAAPPAAVAPAAAPRPRAAAQPWRDPANWAALRIGMTWNQVKAILGTPGQTRTGVFNEVMYFPDQDGGRVEFDRNGRVSKWSETPGD